MYDEAAHNRCDVEHEVMLHQLYALIPSWALYACNGPQIVTSEMVFYKTH